MIEYMDNKMDIESSLKLLNTHWKKEFKIKYKNRNIYKTISKFMKTRQIIALAGLRRTGKTTLMFKILQDALDSGFDAENIVYFSFDEFKNIKIRSVLEEYSKLMKKNIWENKYLILFDEIQKVNDWENQIKTIYDIHENIKIVISGSESLFIRKRSKESLAGRIFEFKIKPLSFKEFLDFKDFNISNIRLYERELYRLFWEFVYSGGFPELVNKDKEEIRKYLRETIIEKIIYKDIPSIFSIKDPSILESILKILITEPGQLIDINKFSKELGISRHSASNYLNYLEDSYLIFKLYNFSKNWRKSERKLKKYYSSIPALALLYSEDILTKSKVFENIIAQQLSAEFFWRDSYKNEVDIIKTEDKKIIPIEVKYGKINTEGLTKFMNKFKVKKGIIISNDKENKLEDENIEIIPAYIYLLENC